MEKADELRLEDHLIEALRKYFLGVQDHRRRASCEISLVDALMSAFAVFSLKFPSLLQFEEQVRLSLKKPESHRANLTGLFGVARIPSDTQMREILDEVDPEVFRGAYDVLFKTAQRSKWLKEYEFLDGHYLMSLDGTGYFHSTEVHCGDCQKKEVVGTNGEIELHYSHSMLGAVLMSPDEKAVIPLNPEPIHKRDGMEKNDCERKAARRFLENFRQSHPKLKVIVVEDALAANGPHIRDLKDYGMHFILGVKPGSHEKLFQAIETNEARGNLVFFEKTEIVGEKIKKKRTHRFKYLNGIFLNWTNVDLTVNFLDYTETTEWIDAKGRAQKKVIHFSWITDLEINNWNVMKLMRGGRARWQIENETFNTLKNQGYEFEHNFGHGNKNLSTVFAKIMMLVFLFDQLLQIGSVLFKAALQSCRKKIVLWNQYRSLYGMRMDVKSFSEFLHVIAYPGRYRLIPDTS